MINVKPVFLSTDLLLYLLVLILLVTVFYIAKRPHLKTPWLKLFKRPVAIITATILGFYLFIGLLDSVHFRPQLPSSQYYSSHVKSLLDMVLYPISEHSEKTYSSPFALTLYSKETKELPSGEFVRTYPSLTYAGKDLKKTNRSRDEDILIRGLTGVCYALAIFVIFLIIYSLLLSLRRRANYFKTTKELVLNHNFTPHRIFLGTLFILILISAICMNLAAEYHILGTDKVGQDVFYQALKSIRTGLMIGTLTTLVMLPFALLLGTMG